MKRFLRNTILYSIPPIFVFIVLALGYVKYDPFKLLYKYDIDSIPKLNLNREFVSTEMFIKHNPKQKFDSFILGSSRTLGYNPETWKKHLPSKSNIFVFDSSNENLLGIYHKLIYLESCNVLINNALILIDTDYDYFDLGKKKGNYLSMEYPKILNNNTSEWYDFHSTHFFSYLNLRFIISYYGYELLEIDNQYTRLHRLRSKTKIESPSNWTNASYVDKYINQHPQYHTSDVFYDRNKDVRIIEKQINEGQKNILIKIKQLLGKHKTNYRIIINPLYNQRKYDPSDLKLLENLFGTENVYDFSGKNSFTELKFNYYENSHFRIHVGDSIINYIYQDNK